MNNMSKTPFLIAFFLMIASWLTAQPTLPYKLQEVSERLKEQTEAINENTPENQSPVNGMDSPVNESESPESEVHAAINPLDSSHIIVAAIQQSASTLKFSIYVTFDAGNSWEQSSFDGTITDELVFGGGDPMLGFEEDGTPYFSWLTLSGTGTFVIEGMVRLNRATSLDGGLSWEMDDAPISVTPIEVILIIVNIDSFIDKQWIVTDHSLDSPYKGNEYAAFAKLYVNEDETVDYDILLKRKEAGTTAYQLDSVVVNGDLGYLSQFVSLDVDRLGNLHLIFCAQASMEDLPGLYYTQSSDGGESFSNPTLITQLQLECFPNDGTDCEKGIAGVDNMRVYPCAHIRADRSGGEFDGNLYITFTANGLEGTTTEGADIYFAKSEDQGSNWSTPVPISSQENPSLDDFFSMIEVNSEGVINISWYDRREDSENLMTNYYTAFSRDAGESFESAFSITSTASDFSIIDGQNNGFGVGEYNAIVSTAEEFFIFWGDGRSNDGNVNVYMSKISAQDSVPTSWQELSSISPLFNLERAYPNPFGSSFQVEINLNKASDITVDLFDLQGKQISSNDYGYHSSGQHSLTIDGLQNHNESTYICVVRSDFGFVARKVQKR